MPHHVADALALAQPTLTIADVDAPHLVLQREPAAAVQAISAFQDATGS